jgi:uncharacterized protein (TIGR00730 family)
VYCGSSARVRPVYLEAAAEMGRALAARRLTIVYGGGRSGLMGALADAALLAGGAVIGVIPDHFHTAEHAHNGLTALHVVPSMHERKARMAGLAQGFVALPGGYGTFEELFEILTWAQIGLHSRPIGLLNTQRYFDPLLALIDHAASEGFLEKARPVRPIAEPHPEPLLSRLMQAATAAQEDPG